MITNTKSKFRKYSRAVIGEVPVHLPYSEGDIILLNAVGIKRTSRACVQALKEQVLGLLALFLFLNKNFDKE